METELLKEKPIRQGNTPARTVYDLTNDVAGFKIVFVNVFMVGKQQPGSRWVLIDAGLKGSAARIQREAETRFGEFNPPQAIVLTHGHFDHVGALSELLNIWGDVPVYAHPLEFPYLTGKSSYPPPDPGIGGGAMAALSFVFPTGPSNFGDRIQTFPSDGFIPELPDWRVIHTPGHSPGHVSLFREKDKILIAGDAFTATNQSSVIDVVTQRKELHGPPTYFTCDWRAAKKSVKKLAKLNPHAAGTGHGVALHGKAWRQDLQNLAEEFDDRATPSNGRYVRQPAKTDETGVVEMPTPVSYYVAQALALAVAAGIAWVVWGRNR